MPPPLKGRHFLILIGSFLVVLSFWLFRPDRRTPDERTYAAMLNNFDWQFRSYRLPGHTLLPASWKLLTYTYFQHQVSANQQKLLESGYLTNCQVSLSNYPPTVTNNDSRAEEIRRRLDAAGFGRLFLTFVTSMETDEESVNLVCRTQDAARLMEAVSKPWLTNIPPQLPANPTP